MTTPKNDKEDPTKNEKKKKKVKAPIVVPPTLNSALLIVKGVLAGGRRVRTEICSLIMFLIPHELFINCFSHWNFYLEIE